MLPLSALLSSLSGTAHAQLTHNWLTHTEQPLTHSLTHSHSHRHSHTSGCSPQAKSKSAVRRRRCCCCSGLENISPQLASFASPRLVCSLRPTAVAFLLLWTVLIVVVLVLGVFHWTIFVERRRTRKKIFPRRSACVFACDSTRYNNSNNKKTKRYINSSVRHFDNVFAQILLECEGGDSAQSKNRGPRLSSPLLFTSRLFYAEKGHCETKPKTERSITNSSHLALGLFRLSPSPRLLLPPSLSLDGFST